MVKQVQIPDELYGRGAAAMAMPVEENVRGISVRLLCSGALFVAY
jgi:hypothetical protein